MVRVGSIAGIVRGRYAMLRFLYAPLMSTMDP